jgi:hypothetical protein
LIVGLDLKEEEADQVVGEEMFAGRGDAQYMHLEHDYERTKPQKHRYDGSHIGPSYTGVLTLPGFDRALLRTSYSGSDIRVWCIQRRWIKALK